MRRQNASDAQAAVMSRSAAIRQIEKNLVEISDLSTEIAQLVQKHEPATMQIEEDAREVVKDVEKADTNLSKAIISARNVRKYKWYILFVCCEYKRGSVCFWTVLTESLQCLLSLLLLRFRWQRVMRLNRAVLRVISRISRWLWEVSCDGACYARFQVIACTEDTIVCSSYVLLSSRDNRDTLNMHHRGDTDTGW